MAMKTYGKPLSNSGHHTADMVMIMITNENLYFSRLRPSLVLENYLSQLLDPVTGYLFSR